MVKPVTHVKTQLVSSVSWELSEDIELYFLISWCERSVWSSDKTHHRQTRYFRQRCLHFLFFFRRGSYKLSYSWNNFLLEGEVIILNKTVLLPNAFIWKAERLIINTIRYRQTLLSFRQTYDRERIS